MTKSELQALRSLAAEGQLRVGIRENDGRILKGIACETVEDLRGGLLIVVNRQELGMPPFITDVPERAPEQKAKR
jgi:hypothetical protein